MKDLIHPITKKRLNVYDIEGQELLKHYIRLVQKVLLIKGIVI